MEMDVVTSNIVQIEVVDDPTVDVSVLITYNMSILISQILQEVIMAIGTIQMVLNYKLIHLHQ